MFHRRSNKPLSSMITRRNNNSSSIMTPIKRDLHFKNLERAPQETQAMGRISTIMAKSRHVVEHVLPHEQHDDSNLPHQYYIPPSDEGTGLLHGITTLGSMSVVDFIMWQFKTSFLNVLIAFLIIYLVLVVFFSTILYGLSEGMYRRRDQLQCVWPYEPGNTAYNMEVAFGLSWTTFATVGYGTISPSIEQGCYVVRFAAAIEAYLGMLFAGYSTAIIFAKVTRVLTKAYVTFSSTICIEFAQGVQEEEYSSEHGTIDIANSSNKNEHQRREEPFPVAEFRIVNNRANQKGSEILSASVSCIVFTNIPLGGKGGGSMTNTVTSESIRISSCVIDDKTGSNERIPLSKRKFQTLPVQTDSHPCFKKVWYIRHTLNLQSPLVKPEVKRQILECGGHWPSSIHDHESVRTSLVEFNDIVVTFTGTSKITTTEVFTEKHYKFQDVHVGWQFAGVMYNEIRRNGKQKLRVDHRLVHDILPQPGGRNEPIGVDDDEGEGIG